MGLEIQANWITFPKWPFSSARPSSSTNPTVSSLRFRKEAEETRTRAPCRAAEKRKSLEERQKKEEAVLVAALDALEKIDYGEISKLGLGDGRLAKLKQMAASRRQATQTFTTVGNTIGGPPISTPPPKQ